MNKESETAGDRDFFSELVKTPVIPCLSMLFLRLSTKYNPMFYFQLVTFGGTYRASFLINETNRTGCYLRDKSRTDRDITSTRSRVGNVCSSENDPTRAVFIFCKHKR